jgi:ribosomal protein S18 acetylase RimI-like enzyme
MSNWRQLTSTELETVVHIEELSLSAWPSLETMFFDGWTIRFSDGYTKRSNSVVPLSRGKQDIDGKVKYCRQIYNDRHLPTIFKLSETSLNADLDEYLALLKFDQIDETMVQTCSLSTVAEISTDCLDVQNGFSSKWITGFFYCSGLEDPAKQATAKALLARISDQVVAVRKAADGRTAGCGFGVVQDQFVGLFDISVHKDFRRQGIATEIVSTILKRAKSVGATTAYLQVMANNEPALNLYKNFGFKEAYRYCYRIKQPDHEKELELDNKSLKPTP